MMSEPSKIKFSVSAPAKINLTLRVTGRRANGYHDLDMVMVKLDLCDEIEIEARSSQLAAQGKNIEIFSESPVVPKDSSNSMWKAVELLQKETGKNFAVKITIQKNIPVAAGLGGGTSDAASVLKSLNEKLDLGVSSQRLKELAVKIGADVPFFLCDGPQRVTGIGDILEPTQVKPLYVILMNPGFPVSTKDVYGWWDELESPSELTALKTDATRPDLENDLEKVVIPRYPVLAQMKEALLNAGALGALMSGSGGTVFGLYDSKASCDQGFEVLKRSKKPEWWICKSESSGC
ncbi:MAG: 4-(cytidine 5'-diphospho)-2-C-methyl-D-erythritol kinase [Deltaproteobacteria bacterium]|nr:MAG: 4-(cytidine 5'-diphospho)-2-C-methyl-D-erythritol kinase [Deltaproteobacteria bacterium]